MGKPWAASSTGTCHVCGKGPEEPLAKVEMDLTHLCDGQTRTHTAVAACKTCTAEHSGAVIHKGVAKDGSVVWSV